ncbi:MAG: class II aldolase/adducin family protein [Gemmatimonadaceae bacterium]
MPPSRVVRRQVVAVCRRLYERGLIAGTDGNVSVRTGRQAMMITPAGLSKVDVGADDLVDVRWDGARARATRGARASTELAMHVRLYRRREDVGAVVHAHPPMATAFAVAGVPLPTDVLPEMIYQLGNIAYVPFVIPGTEELADAMEPFISEHDVFLFSNHGATTVGATLSVAHQRMESLEHGARIVWAARELGEVRTVPARAVETLQAARREAAHASKTPNDSRSGP